MASFVRCAGAIKDSVSEIDLNPVFVYDEGKGVKAADALIVKYTD